MGTTKSRAANKKSLNKTLKKNILALLFPSFKSIQFFPYFWGILGEPGRIAACFFDFEFEVEEAGMGAELSLAIFQG